MLILPRSFYIFTTKQGDLASLLEEYSCKMAIDSHVILSACHQQPCTPLACLPVSHLLCLSRWWRLGWTVVAATELSTHAARWQTLHGRGTSSNLLAVGFVDALLKGFGSGKEMLARYIVAAAAMAILVPGRFGTWSTFQPPQALVGL